MFLTITTSSGGRGLKSRGRFVEESREEGVKSPNDPKPPNSEDKNVELQKSIVKPKMLTLRGLEPLGS
jgi:hypothetical protein